MRPLFPILILTFTCAWLGCPDGADDDDTSGDDDVSGDDDSAALDGDGDGWPEGEDCDDGDPDVYPGADEQWYDGVDSDCDGDEDPDPCEEPPPAHEIEIDEDCTYTPTGNFDPITEWQMDSFVDFPAANDTVMTPMVGQLTDDNGDGVIDALDVPDIALISRDAQDTGVHGVLRVISGDGTAVHLSVQDVAFGDHTYFPFQHADVALGDIDGDGEPEIVTTVKEGSSCHVGAYDTAGALEWVASDPTVPCKQNAAALHDLEGDGDVEVVMGPLILDGADGALQGLGQGGAGYSPEYVTAGYHSHAVDLDGDGIMEIVAGSHIYDPLGATLCETTYDDGLPSTADVDGDGLGEMVVSGNYSIRVFEHDCSLAHSWSINGGGRGGQVTLADFDGDGDVEIGVAGATQYTVHEVDGTVVWDEPVTDASSNSTGSSVFDFDGDGAAEVVYADEYDLWVYDGSTGTVLFNDSYHSSGTVFEYPVIADVDGDGNAEIVVPNDSWYASAHGVQVIGDQADEWVSARMVWNQKAYYITNVDDDLSIPTTAAPNWPTHNNFRQGAPGSFDPQAAPNLLPVVHGPCFEGADAPLELMVQVGNAGPVLAPGSLELAIYGEDAAGARTRLDATPLGDALLPGVLSAPYTFTFERTALSGYEQLVAVADDLAESRECDEGDNEAALPLD